MSLMPPDALLFIAPGCPHCPGVLSALSELLKQGKIGRLEAVNVAVHPERAAALGVRSAPWTRLGEFEFSGAQTPDDLQRWLNLAARSDGVSLYLEQLLKDGQLDQAEQRLQQRPDWLEHMLTLLGTPEQPLQVRLGISALFESMAGHAELEKLVPALGELTLAQDAGVRADACHYLGLSGSQAAAAVLQACLQDDSEEVREIARDGLESLQQLPAP